MGDDHTGHGMSHDHHDMGHAMHSDHGAHESLATTVAQVISDSISNLHKHGSGDDSMDHVSHSSMMAMTFHGGCDETVLFDWWKFTTIGGLIGSMIAIFLMAVCYEGLKYYREHLFWKTSNSLQYRAVQPPEDKSSPSDEPAVVQPTMCSKIHLWQTVLHAVQVTVSYLLMLIFMTYNSWLCLAVVVGAAVGNFLFGWKKPVVVDITEHCH